MVGPTVVPARVRGAEGAAVAGAGSAAPASPRGTTSPAYKTPGTSCGMSSDTRRPNLCTHTHTHTHDRALRCTCSTCKSVSYKHKYTRTHTRTYAHTHNTSMHLSVPPLPMVSRLCRPEEAFLCLCVCVCVCVSVCVRVSVCQYIVAHSMRVSPSE